MGNISREGADLIVWKSVDTWITASIETGQEVCALRAEFSRLFEMRMGAITAIFPSTIESQQREAELEAQLDLADCRFMYKSSLFLVCLNKVSRWSRKLNAIDSETSGLVGTFLAAIIEGKIVRDIREHDDEYLTGEGRQRDKLFHVDKERSIKVDATSTLVTERGILLGGKLCVEEAIAATQALKAGLSEIKDKRKAAKREARLAKRYSPGSGRRDSGTM